MGQWRMPSFKKGNYTGEVMGLNPMAGAQGFSNKGNVMVNKRVRREKNGMVVVGKRQNIKG